MEPGDRRLARPPSERYAASSRTDAPRPPDSRRAVAFGIAAAVLFALLWFLFAGVLGIDYGALVVAAVGGWGVGTAVAYGAWGEREHPPLRPLRVTAVALVVGGWLAGTVLDWLWAQASLPGSSLSLGERLAQTPFPVWLGGQLSVLTAMQVGLLALFSWRASR